MEICNNFRPHSVSCADSFRPYCVSSNNSFRPNVLNTNNKFRPHSVSSDNNFKPCSVSRDSKFRPDIASNEDTIRRYSLSSEGSISRYSSSIADSNRLYSTNSEHSTRPFSVSNDDNFRPYSMSSEGNMRPYSMSSEDNMRRYSMSSEGNTRPYSMSSEDNMRRYSMSSEGNMRLCSVSSEDNMRRYSMSSEGSFKPYTVSNDDNLKHVASARGSECNSQDNLESLNDILIWLNRVVKGPNDCQDCLDKPPHSYIALISMAILSASERRMLLSDIYKFIMNKFVYYNNKEKSWRNSIRHHLSLNDCFIKSGRSEYGKGNYWSIHPSNVDDFLRGDFRRRQARRKAREITNSKLNHGMMKSTMGYIQMTSSTVNYSPVATHQPTVAQTINDQSSTIPQQSPMDYNCNQPQNFILQSNQYCQGNDDESLDDVFIY